MQVNCPCCNVDFPIEAGFADLDGKRLAKVLAEFEPALGRATLAYLRLFKPPKTQLRMARAAKLVQELAALVQVGTVCADERSALHRPAPPATWAAGIEQMVSRREKLVLPLDGHNYLRSVVFGLADQAEAQVERKREESLRTGTRHDGPSPVRAAESPLATQLAWLASQLRHEQITEEEHDRQVALARKKYGGGK